jgi:hypothetical protein
MADKMQFVLHPGRTRAIMRSRRKRELYRLALAALDVRTAENYCDELFDSINWKSGKKIPFHLTDAFSAAVVVAYARPFVNTNDHRSVGKLPKKWHRFSDSQLQETHDSMLRLRNDLFAHTDQTMSPMTIIPAGVEMKGIGRLAPRTSWQIGRRAIPPETTLLSFRNTCRDLRKRLEDAVSNAIEELYGRMDLPRAAFPVRFDEGL